MSFKFTMEPRVSYLSELLKEIYEGFLKIPRFQRDLVWKPQQQRDLLCSIFEGLPIGALLVWNTRLTNITVYDRIGPFPVRKDVVTSTNLYLMDGLQRLSTLYGTLIYPVDEVEFSQREVAKVKDLSVYCDLTAEDVENLFLFESELDSSLKLRSKYIYMPLSLVFKSKELLRFQRTIPTGRDDLLDRSDAIVTAFKNYKIPVIPLESDDQALVTKSFERINSRGTVMTEAHMLNALSYSDEFDLLSSIERNREIFLEGVSRWRGIDSEFVLMLLKLKLGFELYSKDTDKLAKNIDNNAVSDVFRAIYKLATFAESHLSIEAPGEFPYRLQMLGIASAFMDRPRANSIRLKAWFYITTYANSFGTTARNSQRALSDLKGYLDSGFLAWTLNHKPAVQSLKGLQVNSNAARTKALVLALRKQYARGLDLLEFDFHKKLTPMVPKQFKSRNRRAGFYFLLNSDDYRTFELGDLSKDELAAHFISARAKKYYDSGNYSAFASEREQLMFEYEKDALIIPSATRAKFHDIITFD